ncbi:MAG TPA: aspartate aminotransferase family protein [Longimicrobiales bacterium]|nr:aspartate aminotransferase family protein [Longimicrobiales bacterium]
MSTIVEQVPEESGDMVAAHRRHMFPWVKPYYAEPVVAREAEGVWLRDVQGVEYLDLFAGILTTSLGHCHPRVVGRAAEQARRLGHTSTLYITEAQVEAAERLTALTPAGLERVCFTNSGTEAVEAAITAACLYTARSEVIALRLAYSGRSLLSTNLTGHAGWRPLPSGVAGIKHARAPYIYRSPLGPDASEERHTDFFIDDLVEVIETTTTGRPAALIVETIQGVGGFIVPPSGYLERAAEVIRSYGGLYIADEVQTGFGRTGRHWFGVGHWGVEPDVMVMAKGIANGAPVGATVARDEVADAWTGLSISTFGGNPVSMAAASATMEVMVEEDVPARAAERGAQLRAGLERLRGDHPWIGEVRGMGLMQALEIVEDRDAPRPDPARARALLEAARAERVLVGLGGQSGHVVRMGPSLLITAEEVDEGLARLGRACRRAGEPS